MATEVTLAVLPGDCEDRRVRVCLKSGSAAAGLRLVNESYSSAVGWFEQSHTDLSPDQIRALRSVLGQAETPTRTRRPEWTKSVLPLTCVG